MDIIPERKSFIFSFDSFKASWRRGCKRLGSSSTSIWTKSVSERWGSGVSAGDLERYREVVVVGDLERYNYYYNV